MHITQLYPECLLHLFTFLDKHSRRCLAQTCHRLMEVYQNPSLWPVLHFTCPAELNKKNFILGAGLRSLSICWYSSRVKICNIEHWRKTVLQKSMCSQHQNIVSNFLLTVSERCRNLQSLTLSGCAHVHDDILIEILTCCSNLRSLKLENCSGVTDKMLAMIPVLSCHIKTLHVNFCRNITKEGLYFLQQFCPGLALQADRSAGMVADRIPEEKILFQRTVRKLILRRDKSA